MLRSSSGKLKENTSIQYKNFVDGKTEPAIIDSETGKYSEIILSPEIRYKLSKNIGFQLNFNGYEISYHPKDNTMFDFLYNSNYYVKNPITYEKTQGIDLHPKNWSIGFFVVI